jgi:hypothetical protein
LTTDLQVTDTAAVHTIKGRGRGRVIAAAVVAVAIVSAAIGWAVFGDDDEQAQPPESVAEPAEPVPEAPVSPPSAVPPPPPEVPPQVLTVPKELHTVAGMTALLDSLRQRFGDTTGIELAIFSDRAVMYRPDPNDDQSKLLYHFRGGWGDPTRTARDDRDDVADLGAFDVNAVVAALQSAPETVGINPADVSEVVVDIDHMQDPAPGALDLLVKVSSESGGDGYIYLDSAGSTKRVEYPG